ncbi:MAG: hypothetical protein QW186_04235 [Candidatus Bathyarchaeia archaeon]
MAKIVQVGDESAFITKDGWFIIGLASSKRQVPRIYLKPKEIEKRPNKMVLNFLRFCFSRSSCSVGFEAKRFYEYC